MVEPKVRKLVDDDLNELVGIRRVAFLDTTDYTDVGNRTRLASRMEHMSGVFLEDELVAAGAMLPFNMYYEGEPIRVAGLASVVSAGEHRRKGHVRLLLHRLLENARRDGVGWCLEYPFDPRYYARFGWQTIPSGFVVEAPTERLDPGLARHATRRLDGDEEAAKRAMTEVWDQWAPRYNFSMTRDGAARPEWERVMRGSPWEPPAQKKTRFVFGADEAYVVLLLKREEERQIAYVSDWAYASSSGREATLAFLASLRGQVDVVHIQFPVDDPLLLDLTPYLIEHPNPLQARIVDVEHALGTLVDGTDLELSIRVKDSFCDWNDGTFRVVDGQAKRAEEGDADIELNVGELALLLSGAAVDVSLLGRPGDTEHVRQLASLTRRRPYMPLSDYF